MPAAVTESIIKNTDLRLADFGMIQERLTQERLRRLDLVVNRRAISYSGGYLVVNPGESTQIVGADGVTSAAGLYRPAVTGVETMGGMLRADVGFLKKLYDEGRTDIIDAIIRGRLHGDVNGMIYEDGNGLPPEHEPYEGNVLLRLFRADDSDDGLFRAMLSPRFRTDMDNLDVATAIMAGIAAAGVNAIPDTCSLTDRKLHMRFVVPELAFLAPKLLDGYRSPLDGPGGAERAGMDRPGMRLRVERGWGGWTVPAALAAAARESMGYAPGTEPVVFAGLVVANSDTGGSARTIAPQFRVKVCKNGLTLLVASDRKVHLGAQAGEGIVQYAMDTQGTELDLITLQSRDAVKSFLNRDWLQGQLDEIEALAGTSLGENPEAVVRDVTKAGKFSEAEIDGTWNMFLRGGANPVVASLGNAVTALSQTLANADRAAELDAAALPLMKAAAKAAA